MSSLAVIAVIVVIVSGYTISYNVGMDEVVDILFTGMMDVAYAAHVTLGLTAADSISDGDGGIKLEAARGIAIFKSDGHLYAAVTAFDDDLVQILNITNPANITAVSSIADDGTNTDDLELNGAAGIAIFKSDDHIYAAVTATLDDGVQILNITNPANVTAAGSITDDGTDDFELDGAAGIAIFKSDGHTYAAVAAYTDNGVQILNITNPANVTAAGKITDRGSRILDGAQGITIFKSDGNTYAAVAVQFEKGVQILNITNPASITAAGNIPNSFSVELDGAWGITTFESGGHTYAAVTGYNDDGVQILNITKPNSITAVDNIRDTPSLELNGPRGITTFNVGGHPYVAVAAGDRNGDGVQILDVSNPLNVTAVVSISNSNSLELDNALGITTFRSGGYTYIAVAAYEDNGVQIIKIDGTDSDDITALDNTPPVLLLTGSSSVTIEVDDSYSDDGADCNDTVDGNITPTLTGTVNTAQVGTYTLTYSCVDAAGNQATPVSRTVTVEDTTSPVLLLTGSSSVTIEVDDSYSDDGADCNDTVDGNITPTLTGTVNIAQVGTYTLTYSCVDAAGNQATPVSRTVTVEDTTSPVLLLTGSSSVTIEVDDSYSDAGADCNDNVDGNITPTLTGTVNTAQVGTYTLTYSCVDAAGNQATPVSRTVTVEDTTSPVLLLTGSSSVTIEVDDSYSDAGADCNDNVDGNITPTLTGTVNTAQVGTYTLTYSCVDAAGNQATPVSRTVTVEDTTSPVLLLTGSSSVTIEVDDSYSDAGADCNDNVDGNITPTLTGTVNTAQVGTYTLTYSCVDTAGNQATSVSRTVIVETSVTPDTTPPVLLLTGSSSVTIEVDDSYSDDGADCNDTVDGNITPTLTGTVNTAQVGTYTLTYSCVDAAGNQATPVSRTVTVEDTTPPVLLLTGSSSVTIEVDDSYSDDGADCQRLMIPIVMTELTVMTPLTET